MSTAAPAAVGLVPGEAEAAESSRNGVPVSEFHLANGLDVVVIPDHRTPVVTHMIWYRVGSADEPRGRAGIAHFLEHLMFKGTRAHPDGEFSRLVAELGGEENAFTSNDFTAYFQRVAKEHLGTMMDMEADRMRGLELAETMVASERDVVLEERRMRTDAVPASQLGEAMTAALFVNHPYGAPVIGWKGEIEKLDRNDALGFYRRFYAPNNAILVVAGDATAEEVRRLAEATYGKVEAEPGIAKRARPQEPAPVAARKLVLADERVRQPTLQRMYLVPSYATAKPGEAEALEVVAQALGAHTTGRLYKRLILDRKVAVGASAWYSGTALDDHMFGFYAVPAEGVSLEELEQALDDMLAEVSRDGLAEAEIARAKTRLVAEAVYRRDSQSSLARHFGAGLTTGLSVAKILAWPDAIAAVGEAEIHDCWRWLEKKRSVTGYLIGEAR
jgi:zinc protease